MEAKYRKQKRIRSKLKKAKNKAEAVYEQEGVSETSKLMQIQKIYKKEMSTAKEKKNYIVSKKFSAAPGAKGSRKVKFVDGRLKKDRRAEKMLEKSKKIGKKHRKKPKKQIHKNRRKRK